MPFKIPVTEETAMPTVILLGALDTKGSEYRYVRDRLRAGGVNSILLDVGVLGKSSVRPDVPAEAVARAANVEIDDLRARGDRGVAMSAMSEGAAVVAREIVSAGSA